MKDVLNWLIAHWLDERKPINRTICLAEFAGKSGGRI